MMPSTNGVRDAARALRLANMPTLGGLP